MFNYAHKLVIGSAQFGMSYGVANQNGQINEDEIKSILDLAWENGIDTIDTAKSYGTSETVIGNYLREHPKNSWNNITKFNDSNTNITDLLCDSIEKLNMNPMIVLAHSAEVFLSNYFQSNLQNFKENNFISKIGVSIYTEDEINSILNAVLKPEVIQLPLNILDTRLFKHGILTRLVNQGIEIHVRSVFLQGLFYLSESDLNNHFSDAIPCIDKLKSIASEASLTLPELSLLWLVNLEEVSKVIIGVDNTNQLKMHLETLNKKVEPAIFEKALSICYENETILNPSFWPKI